MAPLKISELIESIDDSKLRLELGRNEENESDVVNKLLDSLRNPLNFPVLDQAILCEDTVCIVLEPSTPSGFVIAAQLAKRISEIGIPHDNISILLAEAASPQVVQRLQKELKNLGCAACQVSVHDSTKREDIAFLGPAESGDPVLLNAKLVHADFVLPIASPEPSGWKSQTDFLYPYFSDVESQERYFQLKQDKRIGFNQEVGRWLGAVFLVAAVNRGTTQVVTGEQAAVRKQVSEIHAADENGEIYPMVVCFLPSRLCLSIEEITSSIEQCAERCTTDGTILLIWDDGFEIPRLVDRKQFASNPFADDYSQVGKQKLYLSSSQTVLKGLGLPTVKSVDEFKRLVEKHNGVLVLAALSQECHNEMNSLDHSDLQV